MSSSAVSSPILFLDYSHSFTSGPSFVATFVSRIRERSDSYFIAFPSQWSHAVNDSCVLCFLSLGGLEGLYFVARTTNARVCLYVTKRARPVVRRFLLRRHAFTHALSTYSLTRDSSRLYSLELPVASFSFIPLRNVASP